MSFIETTVTRSMLPWLLLGATLAMGMCGAAGMYGGYEIANARHARDREAMQQAQVDALDASRKALAISMANSAQVSGEFLQALKAIQIVNTTINKEVQRETQKLIYTDCKLPDSGADLLKKNVDSVNMLLLQGGKK